MTPPAPTSTTPPTTWNAHASATGSSTKLRREWEQAYDTYIHDGARTTAAMLAQGPTYDHLHLARQTAIMPTSPLVDYLAIDWDRTAAIQETHRIATTLLDPNTPPPQQHEIERLAALLGQYQHDEEFACLLLTELGPRGLLELTAQVAALTTAHTDPDTGITPATLAAIQTGLAGVLATATRRRGTEYNGHYYPAALEMPTMWVDELFSLAPQRLPIWNGSTPGTDVYGFQILAALLPAADFDSHFLAHLGGAMIDFEIDHGGSDVWAQTRRTDMRLAWTSYPSPSHVGYDPLIGLLKALTNNPEATRELLTNTTDPLNPIRLPRLDYLLTDRHWPSDTTPGPQQPHHHNPGIDYLGTALEKATTINPDERSYRIVEAMIHAIATDETVKGYPNDPTGTGQEEGDKTIPYPQNDIIHEDLRRPLARTVAHYIEDLHWLAEGKWGIPETLTAGGMRLERVNAKNLAYFLVELSKDPLARNDIVIASLTYAEQLAKYYFDGWDVMDPSVASKFKTEVAHPLGTLMGAVKVGAEEAIRRDYRQADAANNQVVASKLFWMRLGERAVTSVLPGDSIFGFVSDAALGHLEGNWHQDSTGVANYHVGEFDSVIAETIKDMVDVVVYEE